MSEAIRAAIWSVINELLLIYFVLAVTIGGINHMLTKYTDIGRDDTDPPGDRSDLKILTDHLTGCQYLTTGKGGITPRLDKDGRHMCNKEGGAA